MKKAKSVAGLALMAFGAFPLLYTSTLLLRGDPNLAIIFVLIGLTAMIFGAYLRVTGKKI